MKRRSDFRIWVQKIWYENCDEHEFFRERPYTMQEYFQKFKYYLKREFRYQNRIDK